MRVNEHGQIVGDTGIQWERNRLGVWSVDPFGYFIEHIPSGTSGSDIRMKHVDKRWTLFRRQDGALGSWVRQPIYRGTVRQCLEVAEIYDIRRCYDISMSRNHHVT